MTTVNKHPIESEDGSSIAVGKLPRKSKSLLYVCNAWPNDSNLIKPHEGTKFVK